jgi:hypothetical protein
VTKDKLFSNSNSNNGTNNNRNNSNHNTLDNKAKFPRHSQINASIIGKFTLITKKGRAKKALSDNNAPKLNKAVNKLFFILFILV